MGAEDSLRWVEKWVDLKKVSIGSKDLFSRSSEGRKGEIG